MWRNGTCYWNFEELGPSNPSRETSKAKDCCQMGSSFSQRRSKEEQKRHCNWASSSISIGRKPLSRTYCRLRRDVGLCLRAWTQTPNQWVAQSWFSMTIKSQEISLSLEGNAHHFLWPPRSCVRFPRSTTHYCQRLTLFGRSSKPCEASNSKEEAGLGWRGAHSSSRQRSTTSTSQSQRSAAEVGLGNPCPPAVLSWLVTLWLFPVPSHQGASSREEITWCRSHQLCIICYMLYAICYTSVCYMHIMLLVFAIWPRAA